MTTMILERKMNRLPSAIQQEVSDYIDFLLYKYRINSKIAQPQPRAGCMKGVVTWMSDDFNAPLSDFKDYM